MNANIYATIPIMTNNSKYYEIMIANITKKKAQFLPLFLSLQFLSCIKLKLSIMISNQHFFNLKIIQQASKIYSSNNKRNYSNELFLLNCDACHIYIHNYKLNSKINNHKCNA